MTQYESVKPAQYLHLAYVMLHLWPRGEEELAGLAMTREDGFKRFAHYVATGVTSGCVLADGVPILASGIVREGPTAFTWFQATPAFDEHARHITRIIRREALDYPGVLHIYSQCVHEKTERWFHALGFVRDQWQGVTPTGRPLYRFGR